MISYCSDLGSVQLLYFAVGGGLERCGFPVYLTCWLRHVGQGADFCEVEEARAFPPCQRGSYWFCVLRSEDLNSNIVSVENSFILQKFRCSGVYCVGSFVDSGEP